MLLRSLLILPCLLPFLAWTARTPAAQPAAAPSPPAQILTAARGVLAERFPHDAHRLDVRLLRTGGDLDGTTDLRLVLPAGGGLPRAHTQVDVLTRSPGQVWRKAGWALLYVAHFDSVLVTRTSLQAGQALETAHVNTAWIETTQFRGEPMPPDRFRTLCQDGAVYAARPLRADQALRRTDLRPPYAADPGATVLMQYRRQHLVLHLPCKAREQGAVGDVIRVYSPDTGTTYRARLTAEGAAEWVETL